MAKRKRNLKPIPEFGTETEERRFWETHDSTRYVDWSSAKLVRFSNLKPSTETISLRLPAGLLADLKALANRQDVPYQSLLKVFLADRVAREWLAVGPRGAALSSKAKPTSSGRRKARPRARARAARG
jgi:predicted DNA binding CopG/RHH family protein